MLHQKITIVIRGKSESDIEFSLNKAVDRIKDGCTSGMDSNEDGSFYFNVANEVPCKEQSK